MKNETEFNPMNILIQKCISDNQRYKDLAEEEKEKGEELVR